MTHLHLVPSSAPPSPLAGAYARFAAVSHELLAERALLERTDSKFVVGERGLPRMLDQLLESYGVVLAGGSAVASYETLYFDTPELGCYRDHLRGVRPRHKVRIRRYLDRGVCFLEVKSKLGRVTDKHRVARRFDDMSLATDDVGFVAAHCDVSADALVPQLWTNFSRVTLVGVRTNERITIDSDIEVVRGDRRALLEGVVIVEVKQSPFSMFTPVMKALRAAGHRPVSASKYCTGTALLAREPLAAPAIAS